MWAMLSFALLVMPAESAPLRVFILAGQSNMEGQAVVDLAGRDYNEGKGTLSKLLENPEKAKLMGHLRGSDGEIGRAHV